MLENCQTRHQPGGQRRSAWPIRINGAELLAEEILIDGSRQFNERVPRIDNLIQP